MHETLLECYRFEKYILDLAIVTLEQGGATSHFSTRQLCPPIDAWGVPRYPDKTLILPPDADLVDGLKSFVEINQIYLQTPGSWLGTWINPFTRCCHIDITGIYANLDEAREAALKHSRVLALYNFKHNQTIYLRAERPVPDDGFPQEQAPHTALTRDEFLSRQ